MKNVVLSAVAALLFSASVQAQSTVDSIAAKYKLIPMPGALTIEKTFPVLGSYQLSTPVADPNAVTTNTTTDASTTTGNTTITADASTGTTTTTATDATATGMDAATAGSVTITMDSANKGIVWIDGLPEGRLKGYLQKSPATYRIVSYEAEEGKKTPEGTLMLDTTTNTLNIALGKAYNEVDPGSVFAMQDSIAAAAATSDVEVKTTKSKSKSKAKSKAKEKPVVFYTATKVMPATDATTAPADATQQTTEQTQNQTQSTDSTQQQNQNQQPATQPNSNQ